MDRKAYDRVSKQLINSLVFMRDHPGEQYRHANACEQSFAEGLAFSIGAMSDTTATPRQIIEEFRDDLPARKPKLKKRIPPKKKRTLKR